MEREKLIENLTTFFPLLHKKMVRQWPNCGLSKLQFELLFAILKENEKPMSYYSEKMMISKPNLTVLSDKLIEEELIERIVDPTDRRVVILKLTSKGDSYLLKHRETIKQEMVKLLDKLNDEDVTKLNDLIEEMKLILKKLI